MNLPVTHQTPLHACLLGFHILILSMIELKARLCAANFQATTSFDTITTYNELHRHFLSVIRKRERLENAWNRQHLGKWWDGWSRVELGCWTFWLRTGNYRLGACNFLRQNGKSFRRNSGSPCPRCLNSSRRSSESFSFFSRLCTYFPSASCSTATHHSVWVSKFC